MADSNRRQDKSHVGENQEYDPPASVDRKNNNNNKHRKDKNSKRTLNAHLNDLCILLIRILILSSSLTCCYYLIRFFFHMPYLCSDFSGIQIENLPPGIFTNNTELNEL